MTGDDYSENEDTLLKRFSGSFGAFKANASMATPAIAPPHRAFGDVDREARKQRERKIARTEAQRTARGAARNELINFKTTLETYALLMQVAAEREITMTAVIEEGLTAIASKHAKASGTDIPALIERGLVAVEKKRRKGG